MSLRSRKCAFAAIDQAQRATRLQLNDVGHRRLLISCHSCEDAIHPVADFVFQLQVAGLPRTLGVFTL